MDLNMLMSGIDFSEIETHLKDVIEMVKSENKNVVLEKGEDNVYILLDIKEKDIVAYRVTSGVISLQQKDNTYKNYLEIKRTLGKWNLTDLKNLVGSENSLPIENTLKRLLPIISGFNSLQNLKENEKRVSIQLHINENDIIAYQIVLAVHKQDEKSKLVVSRILGKYNLNEYLQSSKV